MRDTTEDLERGEMKSLKLRLVLALVDLLFLTGCGALKDLSRGLDDLLKGITLRFP